MTDQDIIQEKVREFIAEKTMFTSVDIGNAIKKDGTFIRNREVAAWLRSNSSDPALFPNYDMTLIPVNGGNVQATLYYPCFKDPSEYNRTNQKALSPKDLSQMPLPKVLKQPGAQPVASTTNVQPATKVKATKKVQSKIPTPAANGDYVKTIYARERIKIPGWMIKMLGWRVGDYVDLSKIKSLYAIPSRLKVNKDYRLSLPRACVGWTTAPVNVILRNGEILFEKA